MVRCFPSRWCSYAGLLHLRGHIWVCHRTMVPLCNVIFGRFERLATRQPLVVQVDCKKTSKACTHIHAHMKQSDANRCDWITFYIIDPFLCRAFSDARCGITWPEPHPSEGLFATGRVLYGLRGLWPRWWWPYHPGWAQTVPQRDTNFHVSTFKEIWKNLQFLHRYSI